MCVCHGLCGVVRFLLLIAPKINTCNHNNTAVMCIFVGQPGNPDLNVKLSDLKKKKNLQFLINYTILKVFQNFHMVC